MASCTKCEKSKLNQTTEHAEQIHRDSLEFVQKREMQVFRFSVFSSARLRGTTIPNQWRNLVRDGEVGEVGRRESHEVQTRFGAFGWGQCHKMSQESLESPERIEERLGS